ncbi:DNA glycosylase AlkZ-like family protein [Streptomyces mirabilis]|uniref:DNA glycosylase AlkZ-like family protein n=1 Tax=Streptomyces mirabilis TaxID=68239 RepID=UPI003652B53C
MRTAYEKERSIVRSWYMRGTLHAIPSDDARWILRLLAPRILAATSRRYQQLDLNDDLRQRTDHLLRGELTQPDGGAQTLVRVEYADDAPSSGRGSTSTASARSGAGWWRSDATGGESDLTLQAMPKRPLSPERLTGTRRCLHRWPTEAAPARHSAVIFRSRDPRRPRRTGEPPAATYPGNPLHPTRRRD